MTDLSQDVAAPTTSSGPTWDWWDAETASRAIGVKRGTLYAWICRGSKGPPYYRLNTSVRYRSDEVLAWLAERRYPGDGSIKMTPPRGINGRFIPRDGL